MPNVWKLERVRGTKFCRNVSNEKSCEIPGLQLIPFLSYSGKTKRRENKIPPPPQVRVKSLIRKLQDLCFRACNPSLYFLANHCGYQFSEVLTEVFLRILMFSVHRFTFCSSKFHKYIIRGTHAIQVITGEIRLFDFT